MLDYQSNYNGSMVYDIKIGKDTVLLINNHLESNKLTREDKVVYEDMLKDPKAGKVKSGIRQLVNKLAEASAIRSAQARAIAQEIARSPTPRSSFAVTLTTLPYRMPTELFRKIWMTHSPNRDGDWVSRTTRINSTSGSTIS